MRYFYEKKPFYLTKYGKTYHCDHPVYNTGTLYLIGDLGLMVIQQRYDPDTKHTWWSEIDPWLVDDLYLHNGFLQFFNSRASKPKNGLYPTVTIRQIMWALRMKPLPKQSWETTFDHKDI